MAGCGSCCAETKRIEDRRWRRVLWIALAINAVMFAGEIVAGLAAGSRALQADALDFLGDAANYAISLGVAGLALHWRSRAALLKGATILAFGLYVLATTVAAAFAGQIPHAETMGFVGIVALVANGAVALMLYRFRTGDANMRSVWICSRNDALGNLAVLLAALGVIGTGTAWPDLLVALIMAGLAIWGGLQIIVQARRELVPSQPQDDRPQHSLARTGL
ncbi:cation transporter [Novosphingobium huizhouense]|uniref:cation transporter n=1 Tax=Novosphingobium huizhouense TaxID=2866625 RepID=UPI001CD837AC|nr:cation transporter [Novosphingobium huizhouense]